jgi:CRP/FNR family transcriptional regulator
MYSQTQVATPTTEIAINSAFCQGDQVELKNQLFEISNIQHVRAKETIFWEGDPSDYVYEVLEGVVQLSKMTLDGRRQITGFVYPGQPFGLGAGASHTYSAEAVTGTRLCRYSHNRMDQSMTVFPALGHRFLAWTSAELAAAQDQILLLGRKTAMEKIASFLLRLSDRNDEHDEDATYLFVPMTRHEIGDYLGLTTETVSRTITLLDKMGVIGRPDQHNIVVRDLDQLMDLAENES